MVGGDSENGNGYETVEKRWPSMRSGLIGPFRCLDDSMIHSEGPSLVRELEGPSVARAPTTRSENTSVAQGTGYMLHAPKCKTSFHDNVLHAA